MSETAPAITPDLPPHPDYPRHLIDAMVSGQLKDGPGCQEWARQVEEAGGPEIFRGVQFEVPNKAKGKQSGGSRYEVRGVEIHPGTQLEYRHTGGPGLYIAGAEFYAGRKAVLQEVDASEPVYTVAKHNADGELEDIRHYKQADLMKIAGFASGWGMREEQPEHQAVPGATRELQVNASFGTRDPFDHISEQLEAENVDDFGGLGWEEIQPEKAGGQAVHSVKATLDTLLTYYPGTRKGVGEGSRQESSLKRVVVLQERDERDIVVNERILKGKQIRSYFKTHGKQIRAMRLEIPEEAEVIDIAAQRTARRLEEEMAWDEEATLAYLLSYGDVVNPASKDTDNDIEEMMAEVAGSKDGRRRIEALRELITRHGMVNIYEMAAKLRSQFLESAQRLRLPTEFSDPMETKNKNGRSISWALESLADRHYYGLHKPDYEMADAYKDVTLGDPFVSVRGSHTRHTRPARRAPRLQQEIVWEELGWSLVSQTIQKNVDIERRLEGNEIVAEPKVTIGFVEAPLTKLPELTREQAKAAEEIIYHAIDAGKPAPRAALIELGEVMARAVIPKTPIPKL